MIVFHTETQADYDALMIELEEKGYKWLSGSKPTTYFRYWKQEKENSCIGISGKDITFGSIEWHKKEYPDIPIIEYKAKGENMTQEENKHKLQEVAKLHEVAFDISVAIETFARGTLTVESDLQEAKSSAKKLIEKIDEYLETLKPKFKVGDYVTVDVNGRKIIAKIDELTEKKTEAYGLWYDQTLVNVKQDYWFLSTGNIFRHAIPEEIAEYEAALNFHKHGREPFEVKKDDLMVRTQNKHKLFVEDIKNWDKLDFTSGNYELIATVEELDKLERGADDE